MIKSRSLAVFIAACTLAASPLSNAGEFVLNVSAGAGLPSSDGGDADAAPGFTLGAGYKFTDHIAVGLEYFSLGAFNVSGVEAIDPDDLQNIGIGAASDFELTGYNASITGILPLSKKDALFARVGYTSWENDLSVEVVGGGNPTPVGRSVTLDGNDPMLGIGYSFIPGGNMNMYAAYDRYMTDGVDINFLSVGLQFTF